MRLVCVAVTSSNYGHATGQSGKFVVGVEEYRVRLYTQRHVFNVYCLFVLVQFSPPPAVVLSNASVIKSFVSRGWRVDRQENQAFSWHPRFLLPHESWHWPSAQPRGAKSPTWQKRKIPRLVRESGGEGGGI